jgi:uncharacterized protein YgiM (DUF1202 family)
MTACDDIPSDDVAHRRPGWPDTLTALTIAVAAAAVFASAASSIGRLVGTSIGGEDLTRAYRSTALPNGLPHARGVDDEVDLSATSEPGDRVLQLGSPDPLTRGARVGVSTTAVKLTIGPSTDAEVTGALGAGEVVVIAKEQGEWLFVFHNKGDSVSMGWARKSDITVR